MTKMMCFVVAGMPLLFLVLSGCATPGDTGLSHTRIIDPSQEDDLGGSFVESGDIQTVAARMCPEILSVPEIAGNPGVTRIAIAPVRNSTRYVIDKDIFMKRLRLSLNENSGGRIRFFSQGSHVAAVRNTVLKERQASDLEMTLDAVADYIVASPLVTGSSKPIKVAVIPPKNINFVNMNAESYIALLRAKIAGQSYGRIQFMAASDDKASIQHADFLLSGEFIAQSMKKEGVFTPFDESRSSGDASGQRDSSVGISVGADGSVDMSVEKHESSSVSAVSEDFDVNNYKDIPNVTKYLNVLLIDRKTNFAVLEKLFTIERKIEQGIGRSNFVLAGELSALSKASAGGRSDYVLTTFQLIDPESNEIVWERGYETKRVSSVSVIYK